MINKREKTFIDALGKTKLFADEGEDVQVTVVDFEEENAKEAPESNGSEEKVGEAKKKNPAIFIVAIIIGLILGFGAGYGITAGIFALINSQPKDFTAGNMTITLNESFEQYNLPQYSAVYASDDIEVFVTKTASTAGSAAAYAESIIIFNRFDCQLQSEDGLNFFIHNSTEEDGKDYQNYYFTYKNENSFWLIQFSVLDSQAWMYDGKIMEWAGSVSFS